MLVSVIVVENVMRSDLIYGSAIAFEPSSWTGPPYADPGYLGTSALYAGEEIFCPYAYKGAEWDSTSSTGTDVYNMDLGTAYDYTEAGTEWYEVPADMYRQGEFTGA